MAFPRFGRSPAAEASSAPSSKNEEAAVAAAASSEPGKWDLPTFHGFIQARTGSNGLRASSFARECYWVMRGQLSNPFTGDVVAAVRGVEVVRLVGSSAGACLALPGTKRALHLHGGSGGQAAAPSSWGGGVGDGNGAAPRPEQWRAVASVLSAKSFRFFHPLTGQPLLTFRPSPRAKPRAVPAATTMLQAVTYALSRQGHLQLVAETVNGGLLSVRDEGQGSAAAGGRKGPLAWWPPAPLRRAPRRFELSLLMWPGSKKQQRSDGDGATGAGGGGGGGLGAGLGGIPWSSLVQLGASSSQPPCRELYAFSTEPARGRKDGRRPRMRYLRYGECPHWCGAGRVCHLTLEGVRYDRLQDIPKADRELFFPAEGRGGRRRGFLGRGKTEPPSGGERQQEEAPVAVPLTALDFAEEQEREKRRRRKRFFFF